MQEKPKKCKKDCQPKIEGRGVVCKANNCAKFVFFKNREESIKRWNDSLSIINQ